MPKTSLDVITYAYQHLGIAKASAPLQSHEQDIGKEILDALFAEYALEGLTELSDVENIPDAAFLGVGQMLAVELAGNRYGVPRNEQDWRNGLTRLRRLYMQDDREDRTDLDQDGIYTAGESDAYKRAQFY